MAVLEGDNSRTGDRPTPPRTFGDYWSLRWNTAVDLRTIRLFRGRSKTKKSLGAPEKEAAAPEIDAIVFKKHAERVRSFLLVWAEEWVAVGQNTRELFEKRPEIKEKLDSFLSEHTLAPLWSSSGPSLPVFPRKIKISPQEEAARLFFKLLTHPECGRLAKCDRCGRLYLKPTRRANKRFCSRQCGNAATSQRPSRIAEENDRLNKVEEALRRFPRSTLGRSDDWKGRLQRETGFTLHWITRREREGVIKGREHEVNRSSIRRAHATRQD
jgi:hypothetical protein